MKSCSRVFFVLVIALQSAACDLLPPNHVDDPTENLSTVVPVHDVVKSLRCEITSFLTVNRIRLAIVRSLKQDDRDLAGTTPFAKALERYPTMNVDQNQYAAIQLDLKNVDSATLSLGYDWKKPSSDPKGSFLGQTLKSNDLRDYHFGPSIAGASTFELVQALAVQQNADLGPALKNNLHLEAVKGTPLPIKARNTSAYEGQPEADADFYCYKPLAQAFPDQLSEKLTPTEVLEATEADLNSVARHNHPTVEKFRRIYVGTSNITLAEWLSKQAEELYRNDVTLLGTSDRIYYGQIKYSFALEIHPSIDLKYTLIASLTNPLSPELQGGADHTSTFSLWINSNYAALALTASQGNSCIVKGRDADDRCIGAKGPFGFPVGH